jgi:hypothetical protein
MQEWWCKYCCHTVSKVWIILSSQVCLPVPFRCSWDILFKVLYIDTFVIFFMHAACLNYLVHTDLTMDLLWHIILSALQYYVHNFFVRLRDQVTNWWPCHASVSQLAARYFRPEFICRPVSVAFFGGQSGTQINVFPSASVFPFPLFHQCTILIYVSPMQYDHNIWHNY